MLNEIVLSFCLYFAFVILHVVAEILLGAPVVSSIASKPHIQVNKEFTVSEQNKLNEQEEQQVDAPAPVGPAKSPPKVSKTNSNSVMTPAMDEGRMLVFPFVLGMIF